MKKLLLRGEPVGEIGGILFDKDGTLINSEGRLTFLSKARIESAAILFKRQNYSSKTISRLKYLLSKAYGLTSNGIDPNGSIAIASSKDNLITTATVFCILGKSWPNAITDAQDVFQYAKNYSITLGENQPKETLLPGLLPFLKKSKKENIKLALISNDTREGIRRFLKDLKLENFFPVFWSAEDNPPKPNPNAVTKLCRLMKLIPSECALIGDADTDMRMACKSNISLALGYTAGWEKPPLIYEHHHLIKHWDELTFL